MGTCNFNHCNLINGTTLIRKLTENNILTNSERGPVYLSYLVTIPYLAADDGLRICITATMMKLPVNMQPKDSLNQMELQCRVFDRNEIKMQS